LNINFTWANKGALAPVLFISHSPIAQPPLSSFDALLSNWPINFMSYKLLYHRQHENCLSYMILISFIYIFRIGRTNDHSYWMARQQSGVGLIEKKILQKYWAEEKFNLIAFWFAIDFFSWMALNVVWKSNYNFFNLI
jgi:hypothetical protein